MRISFDFDNTLSRERIQDMAKLAISAGHEVFVVTSRLSDFQHGLRYDNSDLYDITDLLGIPRDHIIFTNLNPKHNTISSMNLDYHIDDCPVEREGISLFTRTVAIDPDTCQGGTKPWQRHEN